MSERNTIHPPELGDDELRRLLAAAGPRPEVPPEELAAIKAAARDEWRRRFGRRPGTGRVVGRDRWRNAVPLAVAATLLVALAAGWWWRSVRGPGAGAMVATVELAAGATRADGDPLGADDEVAAGAAIETAADAEAVRLALRLAGGQSVRLAPGSRLTLVARSTLELTAGAVYVDSNAGGALEVRTPLGSVRDVGTQFEVRLTAGGGDLRVRVREGSVEVERGERLLAAGVGEELTLGADGSLQRRTLPPWHADWEWVMAMAPGLRIDEPTLADYLQWLSRETGWRVRFADEALAAAAAEIRLRGRIGDLSPSESVHVVVPASGLEYRLEEGLLLIQP